MEGSAFPVCSATLELKETIVSQVIIQVIEAFLIAI